MELSCFVRNIMQSTWFDDNRTIHDIHITFVHEQKFNIERDALYSTHLRVVPD
jgi:hypothetical protein